MAVFGLALKLGMTVEQLTANMTWHELKGWSAYFDAVAEDDRRARGRHVIDDGGSEVDLATASKEEIAAIFCAKIATRH
jgi:cell division ATPase FtsA